MKIPKRAKRVFQGVIYDIYQWREKNFDGSEATFEAARREDSVQIIAADKTHVYVGHERQPGGKAFYSFFGGRVDAGESALAAAKRELREESGMVSDDWELLQTYQVPGRIEWNIHYYIARDCRVMTDQCLDPGERIDILRMSFRSFLTLLRHPEFRGAERMIDILASAFDTKKVAHLRKKLF